MNFCAAKSRKVFFFSLLEFCADAKAGQFPTIQHRTTSESDPRSYEATKGKVAPLPQRDLSDVTTVKLGHPCV